MASKKKRRRQRQQAEVKRKLTQMTAPPTEIKSRYKDYKVAAQLFEGGPIYITTVKEHDHAELLKFICRMYEVPSVEKFTHLDVHHIRDDGNVDVIFDGGDWPKGVATIRNEGFVVRGKDRALQVRSSAKKTEVLPAVRKPAGPPVVTVMGEFKESTIPIKRHKLSYNLYSYEMTGTYG